MRLDLIKKPEGVWASFNEGCGKGDGSTVEFKTPIPASEARSVLVMREFAILLPGNRFVLTNEMDGTILKDEADGYRLETRDNDELWIVFDQPPVFGVKISVSGLGRQVGDAFKIIPMATNVRKKINESQPASLRKRDKNAITENDLQEAGKLYFNELVVDWSNVEDGDKGPLTCDAAMKKAFLEQRDPIVFGFFVFNRSEAIRAEGMASFSKDSQD